MTREKDIMEDVAGSAFISAAVQWILENFQQNLVILMSRYYSRNNCWLYE